MIYLAVGGNFSLIFCPFDKDFIPNVEHGQKIACTNNMPARVTCAQVSTSLSLLFLMDVNAGSKFLNSFFLSLIPVESGSDPSPAHQNKLRLPPL